MASSSSFFPSSSSSPMTKKTTRVSQLRATLFQKASSLKATSLAKRQETVFRKAKELSILCGVDVCLIYYGSDGELRTWPKDREIVKDMALRYSQLSDMKRRIKQYDLDKFLEEINEDDDPKKKKVKLESNYPDWDPRFDNFSVEQLAELIQSLERKQTELQDRLRAVLESQRQRNMHYMNVANQEHMQMNHLQLQQQLPNQAQSLAPLPTDSLTVHQYPNMEMYSRLLGPQESGMNEFLSRNMLPYNGFNTNCVGKFPNQFSQNCSKVEDYSVFPQGTGMNNMNVAQGTNGLQKMDMYGYSNNSNNIKGFSHQLVQFQAQRAAPVKHYMDGSTQNIRP